MSEDILICPICSFKCVKSQTYKTGGFCPRLQWKGKDHQVMVSKQVNEDVGAPTTRPSTPERQ